MAINQHQRKRKSSAAPVCQPETEAEEKESKNLQKTGLKTLIHEHSLFFDRLVELIPARFYLPAADKDKVWFQGLSKANKESAKKQSKENLKKAKREKLDPENAQTTLDLLKKSIEDEKPAPEEEDDDDVFTQKHSDQAKVDAGSGSGSGSGSVTYEELRERLRRRIEELRGNRNAAASDENEGFSKQKFKKSENRDLRLGKSTRHAGSDANDSKDARLPNKNKDAATTMEKLSSAAASSSGGANLDLAYGGVRIDEERGGKIGKKRKASKVQMLEKAKKLKEVMEDPGIGPSVAAKHSWKAATSRAAGEKVHDNPKLLKESINKERQKKKKSAQKWKERLETVEKSKSAKQQSRMQNITQRAQDKKMRKIAKREKKLLRPGFEGRKQGFINE